MLCHLPDSYNKGHCVPLKNCTAIDLSGSIISPDAYEDLMKRQESCSTFGKNLVCCEITKYEPQFEPITMSSSISTTVAPITTVLITTATKSQSTTESLAQPVEIVINSSQLDDISNHENFRLLDPKNCGKSFIKRVAHGNVSRSF